LGVFALGANFWIFETGFAGYIAIMSTEDIWILFVFWSRFAYYAINNVPF